MKQYLTAYDTANTVRMTRTQHPGAVMMVEGDTDMRVFKRFVKETDCLLIPAANKDNAIGALEILEKDNIKGVLAIVDADFWNLDGIKPDSLNVFLTDTHDLETMIFFTSALGRLKFSVEKA